MSDVSKINFVCGAIILAFLLAFWLEGIKLLEQLKRIIKSERRKREEVGCWLRGAWMTEGLISSPLGSGK